MIQGLQDWQVCLVFQEKMEPLDKRLVHLSLQSTCFTPSISTVLPVLTPKPRRESVHGQGGKYHIFFRKKILFQLYFFRKSFIFSNFLGWGIVLSCLLLCAFCNSLNDLQLRRETTKMAMGNLSWPSDHVFF